MWTAKAPWGARMLSICETVSALITHAREVGDEGLVYGGGLYNIHGKVALCGAHVCWDTRIPYHPKAVTCRLCKELLQDA